MVDRYLTALIVSLLHRAATAHRDERGYSTETVLITAGLALAALAAIGILTAKILSAANSVPTK